MSNAIIAQKAPFIEEVTSKKYAWCACGESKNQPFCDGSHVGTEFTPMIVDITETKKVAFCGCKQTKNPPFCDGSHAQL